MLPSSCPRSTPGRPAGSKGSKSSKGSKGSKSSEDEAVELEATEGSMEESMSAPTETAA